MIIRPIILAWYLTTFCFTSCRSEHPVEKQFPCGDTSVVVEKTDSLAAFHRNAILGRGINFGNALEAPSEGEWGLVIRENYVREVALAGFNSVRIPICWSAHTGIVAPYIIDPYFLARIDTVLNWCRNSNLAVILTMHHFNEFYNQPDNFRYRSMFFSVWKQVCSHYRKTDPDSLVFEVLNEPHDNLTAEKWNILMPQIIDTLREIDPFRTLIIDVPDYGYHESISKLVIPDSERNVIVSVRYYLPYPFTHQGAHWVEGSNDWLGTTWRATSEQTATVAQDMAKIRIWADQHNRPIAVGEFGSIINADSASRLVWTDYVTRAFESNHFSWSYFDFGVLFRAYDIQKNAWLPGFRVALIH